MKSSTAFQVFLQRGEGIGTAHFLEQRIGVEAAAEGEGDAVLRQYVQRQPWRWTRFDMSMHQRATCRGVFDQFQRMRRHAHHVPGFAGAMACAPGALQQARDAFRAADLQHLIHGREVDAQIQAGGGHHAAQAAVGQPAFGGRA